MALQRHLRWRRDRSSPRHHLYISDTKADMPLPQPDPSFEAARTAEFGADLKIADVKRGTASARGGNRIPLGSPPTWP